MPGRILIIDDAATNRIVLKVKLASAQYQVLQAESGASGLALAQLELPDLVLLDMTMPDIDGIAVCRALKTSARTAHIPVVILCDSPNHATQMAALSEGADEVLAKPLDERTLMARIRSLLRARANAEELQLREGTRRALGLAEDTQNFVAPGRIAIVSRTRQQAAARKAALVPLLHDRIDVPDRDTVLSYGDDASIPDIFVIDTDPANRTEGLQLLSELRCRPATRHAGVLMVLSPDEAGEAAVALDLGASDVVRSGFDPAEIALRLRTQMRRKRQADRLRASVRDGLRLAVTDPLTGLFNRRYALPHLARVAERAFETQRPFALMLLDLDRFKRVNDTYGHAAGDAVLAEVARRLSENLRGLDLVARIGGEEFMIVLPDTPLHEARRTAERLRRAIHDTPVTLTKIQKDLSVSISIGVAMGHCARDSDCVVDTMIARADAALYDAKAEGRNQVTFCRSAA